MAFLPRLTGRTFEDYEDITVERHNANGQPVVRVLARDLLSISGMWCTLAFLTQHWVAGRWDEPSVMFTLWKRQNHRWVFYRAFRLRQKNTEKFLSIISLWISAGFWKELAEKADRVEPSRIERLLQPNTDVLLSSTRKTGT